MISQARPVALTEGLDKLVKIFSRVDNRKLLSRKNSQWDEVQILKLTAKAGEG